MRFSKEIMAFLVLANPFSFKKEKVFHPQKKIERRENNLSAAQARRVTIASLIALLLIFALIIVFSNPKESVLSVEMKNKSNVFSIKNTGNAPLKIEIYESNESIAKITGAIILDVKEQLMAEVEKPTIFVARQNE